MLFWKYCHVVFSSACTSILSPAMRIEIELFTQTILTFWIWKIFGSSPLVYIEKVAITRCLFSVPSVRDMVNMSNCIFKEIGFDAIFKTFKFGRYSSLSPFSRVDIWIRSSFRVSLYHLFVRLLGKHLFQALQKKNRIVLALNSIFGKQMTSTIHGGNYRLFVNQFVGFPPWFPEF